MLRSWRNKSYGVTVKEFVALLVSWQRNNFISPEVWTGIGDVISPALLPVVPSTTSIASPRQTVDTSENTSITVCKNSIDTVHLRKKAKYGGQDPVDPFLLNQVAKHVKYDKLGSMSRDLGVSDTEYMKITAQNVFSDNDQIYKVSKTYKKIYVLKARIKIT